MTISILSSLQTHAFISFTKTENYASVIWSPRVYKRMYFALEYMYIAYFATPSLCISPTFSCAPEIDYVDKANCRYVTNQSASFPDCCPVLTCDNATSYPSTGATGQILNYMAFLKAMATTVLVMRITLRTFGHKC